MPFASSISYKRFPFVRLLIPLMAGIIIQWYCRLPLTHIFITGVSVIIFTACFFLLPVSVRFSLRWLRGLFIIILMAAVGAVITYERDIRHQENWIRNYYSDTASLRITIQEPLVEKAKSYKALASIDAVQIKNNWQKTKGNILFYFKKDSARPLLDYGSQIVIHKPLQPISNAGNPGSFDYIRYCIFHDISYQAFLKNDEYVVLPEKNINSLQLTVFNIRNAAIRTLQKNVLGQKELGVAEALFIGYRDDLDKNLVQSYSNTGVVHIIAISGLHLGMIYGLMIIIFSLFKRNRMVRWLKPAIILLVLWTFTLVAGAAPSVLRSAVMFTFIVLGGTINRKHNIYNTLAASAFCMLIFNPFALWDVGFQLSYAAVLSILIFMRSIYNWLYFQNKILNYLWGLTAVTLSAQIFTVPLILFHFHQFSNLFFISNFIVVPLSGLILYSELLLMCFSWWAGFAHVIGIVSSFMLRIMNGFIENIDSLPFSVTDNVQVNIFQTILLYGCIIAAGVWLLKKNKSSCLVSVSCLAAFFISRAIDIIQHNHQQKLIVYNIPKYAAADFITGDEYQFIGDSIVMQDGFIRNFHLKPSRTMHRISPSGKSLNIRSANNVINFAGKKVLVINSPVSIMPGESKIAVDIIIISQNPKLYINQLQSAFTFEELVFDSSNPMWKIDKWKKDCDRLHLRFHSVPEKGAFILDL